MSLNENTENDLVFTFDLPPSVNALYQSRSGGRKALTQIAKAYREHVNEIVMEQLYEVNTFPRNLEQTYGMQLLIRLRAVENPGWFETYSRGKHKGEKKSKNRYKVVDLDNRIKFLQDCVVKAVGIPDDSQIFESSQKKVHAEKDGVLVVLYTVDCNLFV